MNSARKTKLNLKRHKPLNPLIVPVMQRKAGSHRKPGKAMRQKDRVKLRQTLREMVF